MLDLEDDLPQELEEFADNFVEVCPLNERPGRKATVYRARSCFVDQTVAIKIVPKPEVDGELDLVQRLRNEAVATAAASHPNIVRIQHGGITREGHAYILLEYLDGYIFYALNERSAAGTGASTRHRNRCRKRPGCAARQGHHS